jgi:hypothetical protein
MTGWASSPRPAPEQDRDARGRQGREQQGADPGGERDTREAGRLSLPDGPLVTGPLIVGAVNFATRRGGTWLA